MSGVANVGLGLPSDAPKGRRSVEATAARRSLQAKEDRLTSSGTVSMDTFKWIVSGLLGALLVGVGWFLSGIQTDLREIRKEVTGIRVEAAVASTRLEDVIAEFRRNRSP